LPPQVRDALGAKLGDLALILYKDKRSFAIFADLGPRAHIGEASMATAANLGIPNSPKHGGVSSKSVIYIVFAKSGDGKVKTQEEIKTWGAQALAANGGEELVKLAMKKA